MAESDTVQVNKHDDGLVWLIALNRPRVRNAVDHPTGQALARALVAFDQDSSSRVAVVFGKGGFFCSGADLKAVSEHVSSDRRFVLRPVTKFEDDSDYDTSGPMGFSRLALTKPVIAAVQGFAVAGGLELACWCDLRVAEEDAAFGVFCRRWGVPLIDGGTVRLPRLVGHSRAMDMILTGREVKAPEAYAFGLVNRLAPNGHAVEVAMKLAREIASFPQKTMRSDRLSAVQSWSLTHKEALANEFECAKRADDFKQGAKAFAVDKKGRHGDFEFQRARL